MGAFSKLCDVMKGSECLMKQKLPHIHSDSNSDVRHQEPLIEAAVFCGLVSTVFVTGTKKYGR